MDKEEGALALNLNGYFICGASQESRDSGIFGSTAYVHALSLLDPLIEHLKSIYNPVDDEFEGFADILDSYDIVRFPRINRGKFNFHFDPYVSQIHTALESLLVSVDIPGLLTLSQQQRDGHNDEQSKPKQCVLRECGISLTAPLRDNDDDVDDNKYKSGMELHTDGSESEHTILMSLFDHNDDLGAFLLVPASHLKYSKDKVKQDEEIIRKKIDFDPSDEQAMQRILPVSSYAGSTVEDDGEGEIYKYVYQSGKPVLFDARLLHGAMPNRNKEQWRWIVFYIYEYY